MPAGYVKLRDSFVRKGMSLKAAKKKAARIWNAKHKGKQSVHRGMHEAAPGASWPELINGKWITVGTAETPKKQTPKRKARRFSADEIKMIRREAERRVVASRGAREERRGVPPEEPLTDRQKMIRAVERLTGRDRLRTPKKEDK